MPLRLTTQSFRYTIPQPLEHALAEAGPGWSTLVRQIYAIAKSEGGIVWDCASKYGELLVNVELPRGEDNPQLQKLQKLVDSSTRTCEVCGDAGELRTEEDYWRVLCKKHLHPEGTNRRPGWTPGMLVNANEPGYTEAEAVGALPPEWIRFASSAWRVVREFGGEIEQLKDDAGMPDVYYRGVPSSRWDELEAKIEELRFEDQGIA